MTSSRTIFDHWRTTQTFYREEILDAATYYEDGHGHLVIWHPELGVLKTIALPPEPQTALPH